MKAEVFHVRCLPQAVIPRLSSPVTPLPADQKLKSTCPSSSKQLSCFWDKVDRDIFFCIFSFVKTFHCLQKNMHIEQGEARLGLLCLWESIQICLRRAGVWEMFFACTWQRIHTYSYLQAFGSTEFSTGDISTWVCPSLWSSSPSTISPHIKLTLFQDCSYWSWALPLRPERNFYFVPTLFPALMSSCHRRKGSSR